MAAPLQPSSHRSPLAGTWRVFGQWWRRQSITRQDRYAALAPLASVLLFLSAMVLAFWYLRSADLAREGEGLRRDTEIAQQRMRLRLIENEEQLGRIAHALLMRDTDRDAFLRDAAELIRDRPEITHVYWLAADRTLVATQSANAYRTGNDPALEPGAWPGVVTD